MALEILRFVRQTAGYNAGQIATTFNPNTPTVYENGPAEFSYASETDNIAAIGAANYFSDVCYMLSVNDLIFCVGSDASAFYQVSAVDRDLGTIAVVSAFPSGVIGTANIQDLAVTTAKLADDAVTTIKIDDGAVTSDKLDAAVLQYAAVPVSAAQFNGMYAAPHLLVAAAGANTQLILDKCVLAMTYDSAAYAAGGTAAVQWDDTANGAGVIASSTLANTTFQGTASASFFMNGGVVSAPFATTVNQGLYLSNIGAAYTTGDSDMVAHVWYKVIPTV